ncbi:hypothetical protein [Caballeronia sordidicola]|uniref:hypothetical protein n=1 Tax=Caballeronia sordidicola TaxID=196367 RepID=UPI0004D00C35|nr:hypothetical protein [Caballeronia sordidicola]
MSAEDERSELKLKREPSTGNERSVVALAKLLTAIAQRPEKFVGDEPLMFALKRQSRLASYSRPEAEVVATSRCTVQRMSERLFDRGFEWFDEKRRKALSRLQAVEAKKIKPDRRTKQGLEGQLQTAELSRVQSLVDCWQITNAFHAALKKARALANLSRDPALVERWNKDEATLLAMFSMATRPVVKKGSEAERWLKQLRA